MKNKIIKELYDYWYKLDNTNDNLLKEITDNINNGKVGAETLLDWCRDDYDNARKQYMNIHNITEKDMEKLMEQNGGTYEFMYNDLPYVKDLDNVWNICNEYFDYVVKECE